MVRIVVYEHDQQVTKEGACCRLASGKKDSSSIQPQMQPEEIHATSALRRPRTQGLSQHRLSRVGPDFARLWPVVPRYRTGKGPPLHHLPKSGQAIAAIRVSRQAARGDNSTTPGQKTKGSPGGHRLHGHGISSLQPLLRSSPQSRAKCLANHDLQAISQEDK